MNSIILHTSEVQEPTSITSSIISRWYRTVSNHEKDVCYDIPALFETNLIINDPKAAKRFLVLSLRIGQLEFWYTQNCVYSIGY